MPWVLERSGPRGTRYTGIYRDPDAWCGHVETALHADPYDEVSRLDPMDSTGP